MIVFEISAGLESYAIIDPILFQYNNQKFFGEKERDREKENRKRVAKISSQNDIK